MPQIDTKYLKIDSDKNKKNEKNSLVANRKGGIFILICSLIGMSFDVITLVRMIKRGDTSSMASVIFFLALGVGLIIWSIVMIVNDPQPKTGESENDTTE